MKSSNQIHILVAEDDKPFCNDVDFLLQREGYVVSTAANGREALGIILKASKTENPVELLIADMIMPDIDGLELIDEVQRAGFELSVMAITESRDKKNLGKLLQRGRETSREKPFGSKRLLTHVRGILEITQKKKYIVLEPVNKILLVDDVNISLEMGKLALSNSGATLLTACNGREALKIVKKERPDIVLCDVYMPEMNGDELCKTIKADPSLKNIPVILFSSYSDDNDTRKKFFLSRCDDILVKPYQKQELLNVIRKYVNISTREPKRKPVDIEVDCHAIEAGYHTSKEVVSGRVIDMSIGGMLVKTKNSLPVDTYIEFTVFIAGHSNEILTKGKVVWSDKQNMGIQFLFIPTHIRNFLAEAA